MSGIQTRAPIPLWRGGRRAGRSAKGTRECESAGGQRAQDRAFTLPFLIVGLILNIAFPSAFGVGGRSTALLVVSLAVLGVGLATWASSVFLILTRVPRGELITTGPYAMVKHPLYTGVALLVL